MADQTASSLAFEAENDPLVGTVFAERYEILSVLGEGGMGLVYKARHLHTKRQVAIKMLLPFKGRRAKRQKRFEREAQAASALSHPGIVTIHDFGFAADASAFLVMDFITGKTLEQELEEKGPLSLERFVRIFAQVCDAFEHAHRQGIVHRDIKDSNIMIVASPDAPDSIRVVDFGLAKIVDDEEDPNLHLTETGAVVGTPMYMSPEQCKGFKCDHRSDIYALGCVMYKSLTGQPPFKGKNSLEVMQKHVREFAPPMGLILPAKGITQPVERIVANCLAKEPMHRYQSMSELSHDLHNLPFGTTARISQADQAATSGSSQAPVTPQSTPGASSSGVKAAGSVSRPRPPLSVSSPDSNRRHTSKELVYLAVASILAIALAVSLFFRLDKHPQTVPNSTNNIPSAGDSKELPTPQTLQPESRSSGSPFLRLLDSSRIESRSEQSSDGTAAGASLNPGHLSRKEAGRTITGNASSIRDKSTEAAADAESDLASLGKTAQHKEQGQRFEFQSLFDQPWTGTSAGARGSGYGAHPDRREAEGTYVPPQSAQPPAPPQGASPTEQPSGNGISPQGQPGGSQPQPSYWLPPPPPGAPFPPPGMPWPPPPRPGQGQYWAPPSYQGGSEVQR
jgi:serine/threonine protein kinase